MKEATGEVSGTIVTIVLIAAVLGVAAWLFTSKDSQGRPRAAGWIEDIFNKQVYEMPE